jgi:hypothetical protein
MLDLVVVAVIITDQRFCSPVSVSGLRYSHGLPAMLCIVDSV